MVRRNRDGWELWEQVKKTITPRHAEKPEPKFEEFFGKRNESNSTRSATSTRIVKPYAKEPDIRINLAPAPSVLDDAIAKKITKGKVPIDGRIDLHGLTQDEAYSRLYRFINAAFGSNQRTVLVITGKGKLGEGILRRAVPRWLAEPGFSDKVIGHREAHASHGGAGAFYVRLRNQNRKNRR